MLVGATDRRAAPRLLHRGRGDRDDPGRRAASSAASSTSASPPTSATTSTTGPYFQTGGGDCGFWLALDNGDIVAYKAVQPSGCTLMLKLDHWACGERDRSRRRLAQYPVSIQTVHGVDALIVNLGTPTPVHDDPGPSPTQCVRRG